MQPLAIRRGLALITPAVRITVAFASARRGLWHYALQVPGREVRQGGSTTSVSLVDLCTRKVVPGAALFISRRFNVTPDDIGEVSAALDPGPGTQPGGKAPDASGTIESTLVLQAAP